jgi:hypothetical protein
VMATYGDGRLFPMLIATLLGLCNNDTLFGYEGTTLGKHSSRRLSSVITEIPAQVAIAVSRAYDVKSSLRPCRNSMAAGFMLLRLCMNRDDTITSSNNYSSLPSLHPYRIFRHCRYLQLTSLSLLCIFLDYPVYILLLSLMHGYSMPHLVLPCSVQCFVSPYKQCYCSLCYLAPC